MSDTLSGVEVVWQSFPRQTVSDHGVPVELEGKVGRWCASYVTLWVRKKTKAQVFNVFQDKDPSADEAGQLIAPCVASPVLSEVDGLSESR